MKRVLITAMLLTPMYVFAGNDQIESFSKAKKLLEQKVYFDHRETLYCNARFDDKKIITPPSGFQSDKYVKRAKKVEWEHVVPA
ncbi:endonuclease I, partial [Vibrio sp. 10N.261.55.C9]